MRSLRWRRNRRFVVLFAGALVVLTLAFGSARVTPFVSSTPAAAEPDAPAEQPEPSGDIEGTVDVFDRGFVHEISITFDAAAYDRMIAAFSQTGDKEFVEASVTIDGTTLESVGIRLKGNSTLRSLSGTGGGRQPAAGAGVVAGGGGLGAVASADKPEGLPWLISFDEFIKGQRYQGYEEIALRPVTSTSTAVNEAVSLSLVAMAGEASQQWMYSSVSVNGGTATLRLAIEIPAGEFADDNFESDGVLYKALSTGHFTYLGEDPLAYEAAFKQVTGKKTHDLQPLINLLRWVSEASDDEFAPNLSQHVEVESLARYLALQDLLQNFDDMGGPGQNYYLWYDVETGKFTVVTWDLNLALSAQSRFPGGGQAAGAGGGQGAPPGGANNQAAGGRGPLGGNALKDRFLAAAAFSDLRAAARAEVYAAIYKDGQAIGELARIEAVLAARPDVTDLGRLESQVSWLRNKIETVAASVRDSLQP